MSPLGPNRLFGAARQYVRSQVKTGLSAEVT